MGNWNMGAMGSYNVGIQDTKSALNYNGILFEEGAVDGVKHAGHGIL